MSREHSLRVRLLGAMVVVFVLGLAAALLSYRTEVHRITRDLRTRTLDNQARELLDALSVREDGAVQVHTPADWQQVYRDPSRQFVYTMFDAAHRPLAWSANLDTPLPYIPVDSHGELGPVEFIGAGAARRAIVAARGPRGATLLVGRSNMDRDELVDSLFEEGSEQLTIIVPFALLGLVLIWLISGWSLRPIARASREAARVGPAHPDMRISPQGLPREIQPLVEAVNGALDRLSRAYATERRLTADAAHELRTPLAVLNLRLQRAQITGTTDWGAVERELAQMGRLVDQLLDLARKESLSRERRAEELPVVNLSRVVREAAAMKLPLLEASGRSLEVDVPDSVQVRGNSDDLRDMVRNLLENAVLHGRGKVSARIERPEEGADLVVIDVVDEGPGVPAGQEEAVFQRFRRLNIDTPGSGLGLAIVRQVARSHGGDARFLPGLGHVQVHLFAADSSRAQRHRMSEASLPEG
ncbi:MAG TPA: HAMP domain-containing sensor histidine kinase [Steroidobacteraceae bacterium]|nr:HAMP domain-containing sensor histidine kinase [Steroidobacteraceae bacterium]